MVLFSRGNIEKEEDTGILTDEQACIEECHDFHNFWGACFDEITSQGFFIDCYQEFDSLEAALAEAGEDSEARAEVQNCMTWAMFTHVNQPMIFWTTAFPVHKMPLST